MRFLLKTFATSVGVFLLSCAAIVSADPTMFNSPSEGQVLSPGDTIQLNFHFAESYASHDAIRLYDFYTQSDITSYTVTLDVTEGYHSVNVTLSGINPGAGYQFILPLTAENGTDATIYSRSFAVIDSTVGSVVSPSSGNSLVAGRKNQISFKLTSSFAVSSANTLYVGLYNRGWTSPYIISTLSYTGSATYTVDWYIPANLRLSSNYSIRVLASEPSANTAVSGSLSGLEFSIFTTTALLDSAMSVTFPSTFVINGSVTASYKYSPPNKKDTLGTVTVEIYNLDTDGPFGFGYTFWTTSGNSASITINKFLENTDVEPGLYVVRFWGWVGSASYDSDPVSGMTQVVVATRGLLTSSSSFTINPGKNFTEGVENYLNITYSNTTNGIGYFYVDLIKTTVPYQLSQVILSDKIGGSNGLNVTFTPTNLASGTDYYFLGYRSLTVDGTTDIITSISSTFSVNNPSDGGLAAVKNRTDISGEPSPASRAGITWTLTIAAATIAGMFAYFV